jgi:hypothetical protein
VKLAYRTSVSRLPFAVLRSLIFRHVMVCFRHRRRCHHCFRLKNLLMMKESNF